MERKDREVGPDAPRRERLFAAASAKGVPLRTILTVDAVVIATWVLYRLIGRLREVILWILIAAFIALVLNPAVAGLQRHRFRRGAAVGRRLRPGGRDLRRAAGPVRLSAGQLADPCGRAPARPWSTRCSGATAGWPTPCSGSACSSGSRSNAPTLKDAAHNLGKPALSVGTNLGKAVFSTILALTTIAFLSLFMLLEAPLLRRSLLANMNPRLRGTVDGRVRRRCPGR